MHDAKSESEWRAAREVKEQLEKELLSAQWIGKTDYDRLFPLFSRKGQPYLDDERRRRELEDPPENSWDFPNRLSLMREWHQFGLSIRNCNSDRLYSLKGKERVNYARRSLTGEENARLKKGKPLFLHRGISIDTDFMYADVVDILECPICLDAKNWLHEKEVNDGEDEETERQDSAAGPSTDVTRSRKRSLLEKWKLPKIRRDSSGSRCRPQ